MAKRAPIDEKPFRPLNTDILSSVMNHTATATTAIEKAVEPKEEAPPIRLVQPMPNAKKLDLEKRILFSREEAHGLDRLVNSLAIRFNAQLKTSHVIRALTLLVLQSAGDIERRATEHGPMVRPSNGDMAALHRFDRELARIIGSALRDAPALQEPL